MQTVRIFLASSSELQPDREALRAFLSVENDRLHRKGVYLELVQWEYFLDAVSSTRLQDEYNAALKACDIALCLFYTRAGKYTVEEFDTALRQFQETGKPLMFTYFKTGAPTPEPGDERAQELKNFQQRLSGIGHFYTRYKDADDLKVQFRRQLDLLESKGLIQLREDLRKETSAAVTQYLNSKNFNTGTVQAGRDVHFGDKFETHLHYGDRKIPRALTPNPFYSEVFLGRETELQTIHDRLFAPGDNLLLLVNGAGGVGKTTLASRYYHQYRQQYAHCAWLLSEHSIANALLRLADPLGLQFEPTQPLPERLERLLAALAALDGPCLLVLDNANELDDLADHYQHLRRCANFHLLLTSRITEFEQAGCYRIEGLPEEEALALFRKYYPKLQFEEEETVKAIRAAVDGNTLVLELLAKNLALLNKLRARYSLAELLSDLRKKGLLQLSQTQAVRTDYQSWGAMRHEQPEAIIAAMYDLGELPPGETALLSVFAVLPAERIGLDLLENLLPGQDGLETNLLALAQKGWIEYEEEAAAFKCSPVVQEITRHKNAGLRADCALLVDTLTEKLDYEGGHLTGSAYAEALTYARYAEAVLAGIQAPDYKLSVLCERIGNYYQTVGDLIQAFFFFEKDVSLGEALCTAEPDNPDFKNGLAISYSKLGETHTALGNLEQALKFFEEYNRLENELFEAYPQNVSFKNGLAISYSKLGETHTALGNLEQALKFFEDETALFEQLFEAYPQNVSFKNGLAISYSQLGRFYRDHAGDKAKAGEYFQQCLALWQELSAAYPAYVEFQKNFKWATQALEGL